MDAYDKWRKVSDGLPPEGIAVKTKIDDDNGVRTLQTLVYKNNLWWALDMSMYVYYTPTHWGYIKGATS